MSAQAERLEIERILSLEQFDSLAGWDELVAAMPRPTPFLLRDWLAEWWRHFLADQADPAVLVGRRAGLLAAAAPVYIRRVRALRIASFLGRHESSLADVLVACDEPDGSVEALLTALGEERFDYAELYGSPRGSRLERSGRLQVIERVEAPVLDLREGWDAVYASHTSSKRRNLHRRRFRQLGEIGPVTVTVGRDPDELVRLLEEAFYLHELRWRGRPDGSTFGTDVGRRFHRAALRRMALRGNARILLLEVGGRPAAFHYYFAFEGTMFSHRLGFDPALARFSPGVLATLETLRAASEEGLTRVEFLGGAERYKIELSDRIEPLTDAIGFARTPVGATAAAAHLAAINLRRRLKRSDRLHRLYLHGIGRGGGTPGETV